MQESFELMSQSAFRSALCCLLMAAFPAQMMLAGETPSAMLYTNGAAWLNGATCRNRQLFLGRPVADAGRLDG